MVPTRACILGFDPGTNKMGQAILEFDINTREITALNATLIRVDKLPALQMDIDAYGESFAKIKAAGRYVKQTLVWVNPLAIAYESNYMNMSTPSAFAPLVALEHEIKSSARKYDPQLPFHLIKPNVIKNHIGAKGNAKKEDVLKAFCDCGELTKWLSLPPEKIDHNVIDSMCVAYSLLQSYRES